MFLNTEHHLPVQLQLMQNTIKFLTLVCYPAANPFNILELEIIAHFFKEDTFQQHQPLYNLLLKLAESFNLQRESFDHLFSVHNRCLQQVHNIQVSH